MSSPPDKAPPTDAVQAVAERYSAAAQQREQALCCPVTYDPNLLRVIPQEVVERDYGCGDPSAYVRPGDVVLDLGSGGGKLCFIAAQVVGAGGRVIGVDCNQDMLELARKHQPQVAEQLGFDNVEFRFGRIQDLALDLDRLALQLDQLDSTGPARSLQLLDVIKGLRRDEPLIASNSVDCVISNCVLNLVDPADRRQLFQEIYRVLKVGGRAAISDIVADEDVPAEMQADGQLWSGCISGAWREDRFMDEFNEAGFHGLEFDQFQIQPWQVVNGIEFRSVTVMAYKGEQGPSLERHQAAIYRGPFEQIQDDDGRVYRRGERTAICDRTRRRLSQEPYSGQFIFVDPHELVAISEASEFDGQRERRRFPQETKAAGQSRVSNDRACDPNTGCC